MKTRIGLIFLKCAYWWNPLLFKISVQYNLQLEWIHVRTKKQIIGNLLDWPCNVSVSFKTEIKHIPSEVDILFESRSGPLTGNFLLSTGISMKLKFCIIFLSRLYMHKWTEWYTAMYASLAKSCFLKVISDSRTSGIFPASATASQT